MHKVYDETKHLRKFHDVRQFFSNLFSLKKYFLKKTLNAYYRIHKRSTEKILLKIYKKKDSFALPFMCGISAGFAQAPIYAFFLLPFAFTILIRIIDFTANNKSLLKISFLFSIGYCIVAFHWPSYGTYIFGFSKFMMVIFGVGIILLATIFPTALIFAFGLIGNQLKPFRRIILFTSFWVLSEYLRSFIVFHFPFGLIGYSFGFAPFMYQSVSVWGVLGLSFLIVLWSCSFYIVLFTDDKLLFIKYFRTFTTINISVIFIIILGALRIYNAKTEYYKYKVAIVQGNSSILQGKIQDYEKYSRITYKIQELTNGTVDTIIWPESAGVPFDFQAKPSSVEYLDHFILPHQTFIFNGIRRDKDNVYNTMYAYDYDTLKFHDKHFLVPYGEYLPILQKYSFGMAMARSAGIGFSRGKSVLPIATRHGNILPLICYEITYSGHFGIAKAANVDYIINISNDEWFGKTAGIYQHFDIAKFRAVEYGISVVRAANTGFSAIIDAYGRIASKKTELYKQSVVISYIPKRINEETLFNIWGNIPVLSFIIGYIQYYIIKFIYAFHQHKVDGHIKRYIENRDKTRNNPNYKRRY